MSSIVSVNYNINQDSHQANGLVGFWPLTEVSGIKAVDKLSKKNNASLSALSVRNISQLGRSCSFNGTVTGYYILTDEIVHNIGTGDFSVTIEIVRPTAPTATGTLESLVGFGNYAPALGYGNGMEYVPYGNLCYYWLGWNDFGMNIPIGRPSFLAYVRRSNVMYGYINDVMCPNAFSNSNILGNVQLVFGRSGVLYLNDYTTCSMKNIRFYNKALTQQEISNIYTYPNDIWLPSPKKIIYSIPSSGFKPYFARPQMTWNI
jgi:hypothetical protein